MNSIATSQIPKPGKAARPPEEPRSRFELLSNRNFILLWCAYAVSAMGDHISEMAILKTQDALNPSVDITPLTARMTFMFFLPFLVVGPFAGLLADRLPRRGLMVFADVVRVGIAASLGVFIALTRDWGTWGPFTPLLLLGLFAAVFSPARQSLLPMIVRPDQLVRANGLISGLGIIATMAATLISGHLARTYDPRVSFYVDAATYAFSAVCLLLMRPPRPTAHAVAKTKELAPLRDLAAGLRYTLAHRHVRELMLVAALVWLCGPVVNSVIPALVRDVYKGDYFDISYYRAALGLGFILGAIMVTILGNALRAEMAFYCGFAGIALGTSIMAATVYLPMSPGFLEWFGLGGIVIAGVFGVTVMASFSAMLQKTVADRFRGRVFGLNDLCTMAALLFATGLLGLPQGVRVDRWIGPILVAVSGIMLAAAMLILRVRLRRGFHCVRVNFFQDVGEFVCKFWWRMERIGPSTVPRQGSVLLTANHICHADPVLLAVAARYRLFAYMIAAEYSELPIVGYFVQLCGCIPVRRETREIGATKQAMRHLEAGNAMAIFIQGGIPRSGETRGPKDGVALIALRTGVPVVPAYVSGGIYREGVLRGLLVRHRARIRFGKPVDLSEFVGVEHDRSTVRAATQKIWNAIQELKPPDE